MIAARYVRIPIRAGNWTRDVYFFQSRTGLWDSQFHWQYTRQMTSTLASAVSGFMEGLRLVHNLTQRGIAVEVGPPTETTWEEVSTVRQSIRDASSTHPYFNGP